MRQGHDVTLPWKFDPLEALRRWPGDRRALMLHSARFHPRWSRWSILAQPAGAYRFTSPSPQASPRACGVARERPCRSDWLGDLAHRPKVAWTHEPLVDLARITAADDALWIGYLSYDLGRWIEPASSFSPTGRCASPAKQWPIVLMHRCPGWLVHDAAAPVGQQWSAHGTWSKSPPAWLSDVVGGEVGATGGLPASAQGVPQPHWRTSRQWHPSAQSFHAGDPRPHVSQTDYEAAVQRVIDHIAAGDVFQVNLAQRFTTDFDGNPRALYDRLARVSPAWYGAYLECMGAPADPPRVIASTSPELFLELHSDGGVVTRPIKGTRPAHVDPEELRHSEKDAAELHMIVDLLRNDLGRVARFGSVKVEEARAIETHPTVHHGVATIRAQLREGCSLADLLAATLPGGSITGAPKVRAMQIIDELEPTARGPYCGAIGYIAPVTPLLSESAGGASEGAGILPACFNIAIRTMLLEGQATSSGNSDRGGDMKGRLDFSVGGGIVSDSTPRAEYRETLDKAAAILTALRCSTSTPRRQDAKTPR